MSVLVVSKSIVNDWNSLENLSVNTSGIFVPSQSCNEGKTLDFSRFKPLQFLEISDYCFKKVTSFTINELPKLNVIFIGTSSFTESETQSSYSFRILNCDSLKLIQIGPESFSGYKGDFELKSLPSLETLTIGKLGEPADCFAGSYFTLQSQNVFYAVIVRLT